MAVTFTDVVVSYGKGSSRIRALDHANVTVPGGGGIYGLLGPSGCGKTTFLSACLNLVRPDEGQIRIFGSKPGQCGLGIPGSNVGYMPQSLALHSYFSCTEILRYYCCIHGLKNEERDAQIDYLLSALRIREKRDVRIHHLSEGQKRRVSLACAMIHNPKLLLLDEPTVAVDPLLRQAIWVQLHRMVEEHRTTIIISTHYIQEANEASTIGFMRSGRILAEGCPAEMTRKLNTENLEDVFYRICVSSEAQDDSEIMDNFSPKHRNGCANQVKEKVDDTVDPQKNDSDLRRSPFLALLSKNWTVCRRHWTFLIFFATLPLVTFILAMQCIGPPPRGLTLGLFNEESLCSDITELAFSCKKDQDVTTMLADDFIPWEGSSLSCKFIEKIIDNGIVDHFDRKTSLENALEGVRLGKENGFVHIHSEFSKALWKRTKSFLTGSDIDNATLTQSFISVRLDSTNQVLEKTLQLTIVESLQSTLINLFEDCGFGEIARPMLTLGLDIQPAVEGTWVSNLVTEEAVPNLSYNILPGVIVLVLHFTAVGLTADQLVTEKEGGVLERELSAGITVIQLLLSQMLTQCLVVVPEVIASILFLAFVGNSSIPISTLLLVGLLSFLQSVTGMSFGFFLTSLFTSRDQVIQAGVGLIMPEFLFSGILWPSIGMIPFFKTFADILPVTLSCELARNMVNGHAFRPIAGFFMPVIWSVIFIASSVWLLTRRLKSR